MSLNYDLIGRRSKKYRRTWNSTDSLLYDLAVGAGRDNRLDELAFVTENSQNTEQLVVPSFATLVSRPDSRIDFGDFDPAMLVHAEQGFELHAPFSVVGEVEVVQTVTAMYDKGSGALVVTEFEATDPRTDQRVITSQSSVFIRGQTGRGAGSGLCDDWEEPQRPASRHVSTQTRSDQALLYRLTGDRNPLHSDPAFAARAGFDEPILHGMCTYGETCRMLVHELADSDPQRLRSMKARFSKPVTPGDRLNIYIWQKSETEFQFRTLLDDGTIVIDRGSLILH